MVHKVEASPGAVPGLSLVAEQDGSIVGHVLFSHVAVATEGGPRRVLVLGPLAVRPTHQRIGIGTSLVEAGLRVADELGEPLVVLLGSRAYYSRFGFVPAAQMGLEAPPEYPADDYQALPLANYTPDIRGAVIQGPAWDGMGP